MSNYSRRIAALLAAFLLGLLLSGPFSFLQVSGGAVVIRLNQWTGGLSLCIPEEDERYSCS